MGVLMVIYLNLPCVKPKRSCQLIRPERFEGLAKSTAMNLFLRNKSQFRGSLGPISKMQKSSQFAVFHLTSKLDLLKLCLIKLSPVCEKRRA